MKWWKIIIITYRVRGKIRIGEVAKSVSRIFMLVDWWVFLAEYG